jgi:hypothetical protein
MHTSSNNNSNSQPESLQLIPGSPTFPRDFKSHLRNILLANPFFARICADAWQSARPNSLTTKLLQLNYKKNSNRKPMSNTRTCTHIKVTGVRCGSPALRGEQYCYFHHRMLCDSRISHVALLENEEAIQVSIMEVVNSLLRGTIDVKRGELVLRALNTAVRNSRRVRFENRSDMVRELPADPVVQPRPMQHSKEELAAIKEEMLAEYKKSKQADVGAEPSLPSTSPVGADAFESLPRAGSRSPAPAQPAREIDPTQRKLPAGVKEVPAPQERKNKAHGMSRGKAG